MGLNVKSYVINLKRRPDRLNKLYEDHARVLQHLSAQVCPAVDGRTLQMTMQLQHLFAHNRFGYRPPVMGCALSHLTLWIELARLHARESHFPLTEQTHGFLILEDDVNFCANFIDIWPLITAQLRNRPWQACFLGLLPPVNMDAHLPFRLDPNLSCLTWWRDGDRVFRQGGTHAYLLSPAGALKLLQTIHAQSIVDAIDVLMFKYLDRSLVCHLQPYAVKAWGQQRDSDIQYLANQQPESPPQLFAQEALRRAGFVDGAHLDLADAIAGSAMGAAWLDTNLAAAL